MKKVISIARRCEEREIEKQRRRKRKKGREDRKKKNREGKEKKEKTEKEKRMGRRRGEGELGEARDEKIYVTLMR